jgi:SAM-dependent methyltransferase
LARSHKRWLALGKMQFDYLVEHGLRPEHRMLEIGCGNLRAAGDSSLTRSGSHYGIDISPDILFAAQQVLVERGFRRSCPCSRQYAISLSRSCQNSISTSSTPTACSPIRHWR